MTENSTEHTEPTVRPQPTPIDLSGIDASHPDGETTLQRVGVAVAETVAATTGVFRVGSPLARVVGRARHAVGDSGSDGAGIRIDQIDGAITVSLEVVLEYPHPMTDLAETIRTQVTAAIAQITDAPARVDVRVIDVHGPFDPPAELEAEPVTGVGFSDGDSK